MTASMENHATYRVVRVIGNNFVCSQDSNGQEIILRGLGIGFKKAPGDLIPAARIEKVYALRDPKQSDRLLQLMTDVPTEYLDISTHIIESAERVLGRRLSENVYITLTDHISFAIERLRNNIQYPNHLLWEIKTFYSQEYEIGRQALDVIESVLNYRLPEDEAGFIALHIVNAELDGRMSDMVPLTELIREIVSVVQNYYGATINEHTMDYERFIVHLKFLGQRLFRMQGNAEQEDTDLQNMIVQHYEQDYRCAQKIGEHLHQVFGIHIPNSEMTFLTVHIHRLSLSMGLTTEE